MGYLDDFELGAAGIVDGYTYLVTGGYAGTHLAGDLYASQTAKEQGLTPQEAADLRARVNSDPNYYGTLHDAASKTVDDVVDTTKKAGESLITANVVLLGIGIALVIALAWSPAGKEAAKVAAKKAVP